MPAQEVALRLVCIEANVEFQKMRLNLLTSKDWERLFHAADVLSKQPLLVGDKPGLTVQELRSIIRKIKREIDQGRILARKLAAAAIDYLQLMMGDKSQSRELEVSSITKGLKNLSKAEALCVIALSQTNRAPEKKTGDKRPTLADLRESGAIENDADWVWFVYREGYYAKDAGNEAEIIIAKQRGGATGTVMLGFHGPTISFRPLETGYEEVQNFGDNVDVDPMPPDDEDQWYNR
jgi:replicative DNA helicase